MKSFLIITTLVTISLVSHGQKRNCGFKVTEKSKIEYLQQLSATIPKRAISDSTIVEISVVFHVLFDGGSENISDAKIVQELADLNRDFRLLNGDTNLLSHAFNNLKGNSKMGFRLAVVDPDGKPSTGILRIKATRNVYTFRKPVFLGNKIWDPTRYLNVYIGNIRNGRTRGYVNSYPWRNPSTDAIALHFADVGNSTRLLTHEAGHWFGLFHITEGGCSSLNDGIEDTPKQSTFTNICPDAKFQCNNDCFFMNYMDYSSCRVAFTKGQVQRMQEIVSKFRHSLLP